MINTVIFDLDGTLLYTLEDFRDSTNYALLKFNYDPRSLDEIRTFVGNGVRRLIEKSLPCGAENPVFEECLSEFKKHYLLNMYNKTAPFQGIDGLLSTLKEKNIHIAVVSNKYDRAVKELCEKYFKNKIELAVGESENIRKKPAPDSVLSVINQFDVGIQTVLYVGDSDVDIQTAKNASVKSVGVTWGYRSRELLVSEGADFIVNKPFEILDLLDK